MTAPRPRTRRARVRLSLTLCVLAASAVTGAAAAGASPGPVLPTQDPFYRYTGSLVHIAPGRVLRTRTIALAGTTAGEPTTAAQVLYRTTGELGQATVTVATIIRPLTPAVGGTKIVALQTPYDALGAQCDPSYSLQGGTGDSTAGYDEAQLQTFIKSGDTVVVSDYEGEALDWEAGQESGYGTLDAIRAAEHALHVQAASTPVGMIGYSGGSIATEFASELAHAYAPELDIVGSAEGGVPVDLLHNLRYINGSPSWSGVIPASIVAIGRAFHLTLGPALSTYGRSLAHAVAHQCIGSFLGKYPGLTYQKLFKAQYSDVFKLPSFVAVSDHMIMGRSGTPHSPVFIAVGNSDGTGDGVMVARDVQALAYTYCKRGVSVEFHEYTGDNHYSAALAFDPDATAFLDARLTGTPVPNGCAAITPGNSLAPAPVRPSKLLRFRWLGVHRRPGGIAVQVWAPHGSQRDVAVTVALRGRVLARGHVSRVRAKHDTLILRPSGALRPGLYTVTVSIQGGSLIWQQHRVG